MRARSGVNSTVGDEREPLSPPANADVATPAADPGPPATKSSLRAILIASFVLAFCVISVPVAYLAAMVYGISIIANNDREGMVLRSVCDAIRQFVQERGELPKSWDSIADRIEVVKTGQVSLQSVRELITFRTDMQLSDLCLKKETDFSYVRFAKRDFESWELCIIEMLMDDLCPARAGGPITAGGPTTP